MQASNLVTLGYPGAVPKGLIVVATLLVVVSVRALFSEVTDDGFFDSWVTFLLSKPILAILTLALAGAGIATAIGLWNARVSALRAYVIWLVAYAAFAFVRDSRVEPVLWKLVLGVAFGLIVPVFVGAYLATTYMRLREREPAIGNA